MVHPESFHFKGHGDFGGGLAAFPGYSANVRAATGRVLVNVNVSNAAFYKNEELDLLIRTFGAGGTRLELFLKRVRVEITQLKDKSGKVVSWVKPILGSPARRRGKGPPPADNAFVWRRISGFSSGWKLQRARLAVTRVGSGVMEAVTPPSTTV